MIDKEFEKFISLNKLEKSKPKPKPNLDFKYVFLLIGFTSEVDTIELKGNYIIRKGTDEELNRFYKHAESYNLAESKFVVEYKFKAKYLGFHQPESNDAFLLLNLLFQTYGSTEVTIPYCLSYLKKNIEANYASAGVLSDNKLSKFQGSIYNLAEPDIIDLKKYWSNLISLDLEKIRTLNITFNRLVYSKTKYNQEDQLLDLMISFESFFVNDNSEIAYKLSLRVATFLNSEFDPKYIFKFIKKSYNLRSKVIHGAILKPKDLKFGEKELTIKEYNTNLRELMRVSLNEYIANYSDKTVNELIETLDESIVSKN